MTADVAKALALAARAQAVCDAQHGAGDRCCLMREVADCLRAFAACQAIGGDGKRGDQCNRADCPTRGDAR